MESAKLINSGLDVVNALINYLAKDAVGSDFMNEYASTRAIQKNTSDNQENLLNTLIVSSEAMETNTQEVKKISDENAVTLGNIYATVKGLTDSIAEIEENYKKYVQEFHVLIQETKKISSFIEEVQEISNQTSLLSFNASIEAAHAGSAGAGFRIIANEVKKLSENTELSTSKIMKNVVVLQNAITAIEEETKKNSQSLSELTKEAVDTLGSYDLINKKNEEANSRMEKFSTHISDNVTQINSIIKNVKDSEELNNKTVSLFVDSASKNQMLFNDLYSFVYEIKAIFEDLQKQKNSD